MRHLAMIALLAACGDNLAGPVAIDDYPAAVRDAACRFLARCREVESFDTCLAANIGLTVAFTPSELAAIELDRIAYSGATARSCVDALASRSCDATSRTGRELPDACLAILSGALRDGEVCAFDEECGSARCDVPGCSMACCTGRCVGDGAPVRPRLGESCGDAACAPGLWCDPATGQCAALRPSGEPCAVASDCDYGLACVARRCAALPALGQPCTAGCREVGTTCSSSTHTCVAVGLVGDPCAVGANPSDCSPLYVCARAGFCSAGIALGAACSLGDQCADVGAVCDAPVGEITGMCALPRPDGAACARDAACDSLYCDPFTLRCAEPRLCL